MMMRKTVLRALSAAGVAGSIALLSACGDAAAPATSTGKGSGAANDTAIAATSERSPLQCVWSPTAEEVLEYKAPKAKEPYDIVMMQVSLAAYYYQAVAYGAQQAAEDAGVNLRIVAGEGYASPGAQLDQINNVLQRGADAIVFAPSDTQGSVPVVARAKQAGVPLIDFSTEVASNDVTSSVVQDDYLLGKLGADQLAEAVPEGGEGIVIAGPATATWSRKRVAGFEDQLKKYPKLKVVARPTQLVDPALGLKSFTNAVQAHPDVKWIYSVYYYMLLPESLPKQYQGLPFVTTGFEPNTIKSLQSGALTATATVANVTMGYLSVAQAVRALNGDDVEKTVCMPATPITKTDVDSPVAKGELYPPSFKANAG